jgi:hypothetical protein
MGVELAGKLRPLQPTSPPIYELVTDFGRRHVGNTEGGAGAMLPKPIHMGPGFGLHMQVNLRALSTNGSS